eukprot:Gregarina_sp_Poly_1__2585@NODE_16_length_22882_cov_82_653956_g14_i0_p11_GENE_NODE_16_length_22882_cov_82_653956_g14_i0NODE_16_length_22882_cov_82_653956_g14_i0_p11_ORF_typecomplete_len186_score9_05_NODE_16_length_22882_cov_82_653956_g14_i02156522122
MPECLSHSQAPCPECIKEAQLHKGYWDASEGCPTCESENRHCKPRRSHRRAKSSYVGPFVSPPSDFLPAQTRNGQIVYVPATYANHLAACQHCRPTLTTQPCLWGRTPTVYVSKPPPRGCGADLVGFIAPRVVSLSEAIASPILAMRDAALQAIQQNSAPAPTPVTVPAHVCPCVQMHYPHAQLY